MPLKHTAIHVDMMWIKEYKIKHVVVKMDGGMMGVSVVLVWNLVQNVNLKHFVPGAEMRLLVYMLIKMEFAKIVITLV